MPPEGLEHSRFPSGNSPVSDSGGSKSGNKDADSGAAKAPAAPADPDLATVAAAWADLLPAVRAGIVAMVRASASRACGLDGATDAEIQAALGMLVQTETARRNALAKAGAVVDSGERRLTPSGRRAIVWIVPEFAPGGGVP